MFCAPTGRDWGTLGLLFRVFGALIGRYLERESLVDAGSSDGALDDAESSVGCDSDFAARWREETGLPGRGGLKSSGDGLMPSVGDEFCESSRGLGISEAECEYL